MIACSVWYLGLLQLREIKKKKKVLDPISRSRSDLVCPNNSCTDGSRLPSGLCPRSCRFYFRSTVALWKLSARVRIFPRVQWKWKWEEVILQKSSTFLENPWKSEMKKKSSKILKQRLQLPVANLRSIGFASLDQCHRKKNGINYSGIFRCPGFSTFHSCFVLSFPN